MLICYVFTGKRGNEGVNEYITSPTANFKQSASRTLSQLREYLPVYMVPTPLLPLVKIPLTGAGKINRKELWQVASDLTLAEIEFYSRSADAIHVSKRKPKSPVEIKLHSICAQVLNLDPDSIGIDDNFFHLGGDSISAMQVAAKAKAAGLSSTARTIQQYKTISAMAMLRARFRQEENGNLVQQVHDDINGSFIFRPHSVDDVAGAVNVIVQSQKSLDIFHSPLLRTDLI